MSSFIILKKIWISDVGTHWVSANNTQMILQPFPNSNDRCDGHATLDTVICILTCVIKKKKTAKAKIYQYILLSTSLTKHIQIATPQYIVYEKIFSNSNILNFDYMESYI